MIGIDRLTPDAMEALLRAAVDSILIIDERGIIRSVNESTERTFGYSEGELVGRNVSTLMNATDAVHHDGYLERYRLTGEATIIGKGREVIGRRKDGSPVPLLLSVGEFEIDGERHYVGITHDVTEQAGAMEHASFLARNDDLTRCLNRRGFTEDLAIRVRRAQLSGRSFSLLVIDLDGFKGVNDRHGHDVGDALLTATVLRIRNLLRPTDALGRLGGDEFVVASTLSGYEESLDLADRLVSALAAPFQIGALALSVTCSVGISRYPDHDPTIDGLLKLADVAMYDAKQTGGNRAQAFRGELKTRSDATATTVADLREAAALGQLVVHYQPQFDLATCEPVGLEALVRWRHPKRGLLAPDKFLDVALSWGLLPTIDQWVLRRAVRDNARLIAEGRLDRSVSVNVGADLLGDTGFLRTVTDVLDETGLSPGRLTLEVVEQVKLAATPQVMHNIEALRALGVRLAVDDFGTGYSSLEQLRDRRFDVLKIDQSFVRCLPGSDADTELVEAILSFAHVLRLQVVAEGIETASQRDHLLARGCLVGQGYWYAQPMPYGDLVDWLADRDRPESGCLSDAAAECCQLVAPTSTV